MAGAEDNLSAWEGEGLGRGLESGETWEWKGAGAWNEIARQEPERDMMMARGRDQG